MVSAAQLRASRIAGDCTAGRKRGARRRRDLPAQGYGLGYTVGSFQMSKLLADRKQQLSDDFDLREFHDQVMAAGAIPIALIRYEMTGLKDEMRLFRSHRPSSDVLKHLDTTP